MSCRSGCTGRSRPRRCWPRCRPPSRRSPCWTARRSPVRWASRCSWTCWPRSPRRTRPATRAVLPTVIGGRYGLGSKEFTPGMVAGVFAELARERPRPRFTIGIIDDVGGTSLPYDPRWTSRHRRRVRAVFFGLGSDGTVGANKNTIKILGADPGCTPRATSCTTRRSPARRPCHICGSGRNRSVRRTLSGRPGSSAVIISACWTASTCWTGPRPARPCCSTARTPRRRSGRR